MSLASNKTESKLLNDLINVGKCWLNHDYHLRKKAVSNAPNEFCLSAASFNLALDWIFSQWHQDNILKLVQQNPFKDVSNTIQILAGNTPAVMAQAFLQGAILNVPQLIKVPTLCMQFPKLLLESFSEISSQLASFFYLDTWQNNLVDFHHKLAATDLVIAYGSDTTIESLRKHLSPKTQFVAHGHAHSAAIIFKEGANVLSLEKLAWDMLSYDQRGCLSPRVTFIQSGGNLEPLECAKIFAHDVLPKIAEELPRGNLLPGEAAAILQGRSLYGFRGQVYCGKDWTVCFDKTLIWPEESLPRFMPFKSFTTIQALQNACLSVNSHLICVGYAGNLSSLEAFNQHSHRLSCPLGTMQQQLLFW